MASDMPATAAPAGTETEQSPAAAANGTETGQPSVPAADGIETGPPPSSGRVVHVKGAAALGYFEVTGDIRHWCRAAVFSEIGLRTPVLCRLSTAGGQSDLPDTTREVHGFAVRHRTAEGLWDLVGHDTPVFFIRDPALFPSFIHTQQRNPITHRKDPDLFWDFVTLQPETMHQVTLLFSDRGTPDGYRHMNGYGSHTFKLVNEQGQHVWAKFHYKTNQGIRTLSAERAAELAISDPNYCSRDLRSAIADGRPPSWTLHVQVMTPQEAESCAFDPFDLTRPWPHAQYPLHEVGRLVLDREPEDEVTEVEQAAFAPANMIDGIEPSPDPMLKARLYSYSDTQQHRLGPQYSELPVNRAAGAGEGHAGRGHRDAADLARVLEAGGSSEEQEDTQPRVGDEERQEDFSHVRAFWQRVLAEEERLRLVDNMAADACEAQAFIQARIVRNWRLVCDDFGDLLLEALQRHNTPDKAAELSALLDAEEDDAADPDEDEACLDDPPI